LKAGVVGRRKQLNPERHVRGRLQV
jgi:hypothetical protein